MDMYKWFIDIFQIEKLVLENGQLKQSKLELEEQVNRQDKELTCANAEINKLQSSLFNSMSEVDVLRGKVKIPNLSRDF